MDLISRQAANGMTTEEIKNVLKKHGHWTRADCENWQDMRADLCGADLHEADLREADLCGAINIPTIPCACPDFGMFKTSC